MNIVGLDQSYTGFGYCHDGDSKKKMFPASKYPDPDDRLFAIEEWLEGWLEDRSKAMPTHEGLDLVVMEGYAPGSKFGREIAGELGWAVRRSVFIVTGKHPLIVPPPSLKKFVTGKGNAKKNEMLLGVYKQWGVEFADDNQADAYALEQFGRAYLWLSRPGTAKPNYPQYQIDAVQAVRKLKAA